MKLSMYLILVLTSISSGSCQQQLKEQAQKKEPSEQSSDHFPYDLSSAEPFTMPRILEEISGITLLAPDKEQFYAIQDEDGLILQYSVSAQEVVSQSKFAKKGDYEEICTDGRYFYVLRSDGTIYSVPVDDPSDKKRIKENKGLLPKGEYESMGYDTDLGRLVVLCKECQVDRKEKSLSGYYLTIQPEDGSLSLAGEFKLSIDQLSALDKRIKKTIKPSAMAFQAQRKQWYILSSIDLSIIITDQYFKPLEVVELTREQFAQPEGIAFDDQGNLWIASEAGKEKHGKVSRFLRQP